IAAIEAAHPHARGRLGVVKGDITEAGLGLDEGAAQALKKDAVAAWHLAAVYDLAVARDAAHRINVAGTRHVLEFLAGAPRLERLHYVSTAYVSGRAGPAYRETDLDVGQSFKNHYEETKFLAEVEVVKSGLPATTYRPAIVVGDSRTGETAKFDGPYFTVAAMERVPSPGLFLRVGSGRHPANLVPVDYVIEAMARLATVPASRGRTYHLTDPDPVAVFEVERLFARALGKRFLYVPVPPALARAFFAPRAVQRFFGMPVETLDYFDHPCRYDASQATADLAPLGVRCPRFPDYVDRLVAFYRQKRDSVRRSAMV
ncbi:MAG TPA: SDR family oxidoreductase, partial [Vicinamibacteria bacterium]|nr:SDR family oxidoreductase [Vicinamibacteria bacterium]